MKKSILFFIMVAVLTGCGNQRTVSTDWRSGNITIEKRYETVTNLITKGMTMWDVKAILGEGMRARSHGPVIHLDSKGKQTGPSTYQEEWVLSYDFPEGSVWIHTATGIEPDLNQGVYDHASYSKIIETANKAIDGD